MLLPGLLPVKTILFLTLPVFATSWVIVYDAVYVAISLYVSVPWEEPALAETNVGLLVKAIAALLPSVNVSTNVSPESTTLPLFSTVIV